jgi:hypothetical protein
MEFYLGTCQVNWLWRYDLNLFVSTRRLKGYKKFKEAKKEWCLDSGGFTELNMYGTWKTSAKEYAEQINRYYNNIGKLKWASQQDWMCEPFVLAKTGKTVKEHQELTINNFIDLKSLNLKAEIIPVLQGFKKEEYLEHVQMYLDKGIDLRNFNTVGVGSICRRQNTSYIYDMVIFLNKYGIKIHGFGLKIIGLLALKDEIVSADSMSWSFTARYEKIKLEGCMHETCNNCIKYATLWREQLFKKIYNY